MRHRVLFHNIHHRLTGKSEPVIEAARARLTPYASQLVSEVCDFRGPPPMATEWIQQLRGKESKVAIDRYGTTTSGLLLLQHCDLDYLKIHRSLIEGLEQVARKRVIMAQLIATAHTLGMEVVAVGVETARELVICRELGCDLVQGHFVQAPVLDPSSAGTHFPHVKALAAEDRGHRRIDDKWVSDQLDPVTPVELNTPMREVFARVAQDPDLVIIPVVDETGQPVGVLRERTLRNYAYSAFGKELIANRSLGRNLRSFLDRCPMAEMNTPLDQLMAIYSTDKDADGVLIALDGHYRGFLSARSIIRAMHEKTLARARDQNPLSKLPGNDLITDYTAGLLGSGDSSVLAYIDFDNFKPFNDTYGFRQGDRAILLFADLMRKFSLHETWFLGHIGGDDFFIGMTGTKGEQAEAAIAGLIRKFTLDAESFYDSETRHRAFIMTHDREGRLSKFPLLSASAVLIEIPEQCDFCTVDDISTAMAHHKKAAKSALSKIVRASLASLLAPLPGPNEG
jgi:GGDEF domain-containing protein